MVSRDNEGVKTRGEGFRVTHAPCVHTGVRRAVWGRLEESSRPADARVMHTLVLSKKLCKPLCVSGWIMLMYSDRCLCERKSYRTHRDVGLPIYRL